MKLNSRMSIAVCAIAGSAVAVTGCQSGGSSASSSPSAAPASSSPAPAASSQAPSSSAGGSSAGGSSGASGPLVYDCTNPSAKPGTRPSAVTLSCGDGSDGLQNLTWSAWGAATATGTGQFYENTCTPSCAQGKDQDYQVNVTLSKVKVASGQSYFTQASIQWISSKPDNGTQTVYGLETP